MRGQSTSSDIKCLEIKQDRITVLHKACHYHQVA